MRFRPNQQPVRHLPTEYGEHSARQPTMAKGLSENLLTWTKRIAANRRCMLADIDDTE